MNADRSIDPRPSGPPALALLALAAAALAVATAFSDLTLPGNALPHVAALLAAGALALLAAARAPQTPRATLLLWAGALLLRAMLFPATPGDDFARYLWEGRIQLAGFNPYLAPPDAPELAHLRDAAWTGINHKGWPAIYPPGAELLFAAGAALGFGVSAWKLLFLAADLATLALVARPSTPGAPPSRWAFAYAWSAAPIAAFAGGAHFDALMILPMVLAVNALGRSRPAAAALWLGIAISVKTVPLLLVPLFAAALGRRCLWLGIAALIPLALTLPYGGPSTAHEQLGEFARVARSNDLLWGLAEASLWGSRTDNTAYNATLFAAAAALGFFLRHHPARAALAILGISLVLTPSLHPWYAAWILPFAALRRSLPWMVFGVSSLALLLKWDELPWEPLLDRDATIRALVALPPLVAWLWARRNARAAGTRHDRGKATGPQPRWGCNL
jgi:hypothetical protein